MVEALGLGVELGMGLKLQPDLKRQLQLGKCTDQGDLFKRIESIPNRLPLVLFVDTLDETGSPTDCVNFFSEFLAEFPEALLVVGSQSLEGADKLAVRELSRDSKQYINLDTARDLTDSDIAEYVEHRVPKKSWGEELFRKAQSFVVSRSRTSFFVAGILCDWLNELEDEQRKTSITSLPEELPKDPLTEAFDLLFARFENSGFGAKTARQFLMPLAYAEGEGLPLSLWKDLADAISPLDLEPASKDKRLNLAVQYVGGYITASPVDGTNESGEPRMVYRLFHQELVRYVRSGGLSENEIQLRIVERLKALTPKVNNYEHLAYWKPSHDDECRSYILKHLADHASKSKAPEMFDALVNDPGFLIAADGRLTEVLGHVSQAAREAAYVFRYSLSRRAGAKTPEERLAYLEMIALQEGATALAARCRDIPLSWKKWRALWATTEPLAHHTCLVETGGIVTGITALELNGRWCVVSVHEERYRRALVHDVRSGLTVQTMEAPARPGAVAIAQNGMGVPQIVCSHWCFDETMCLKAWYTVGPFVNGVPVFKCTHIPYESIPEEGVEGKDELLATNAYAMGDFGRGQLLASAHTVKGEWPTGGVINVWNMADGSWYCGPWKVAGVVTALAIILVDKTPAVLAAVDTGGEGSVQIWKIAIRREDCEPEETEDHEPDEFIVGEGYRASEAILVTARSTYLVSDADTPGDYGFCVWELDCDQKLRNKGHVTYDEGVNRTSIIAFERKNSGESEIFVVAGHRHGEIFAWRWQTPALPPLLIGINRTGAVTCLTAWTEDSGRSFVASGAYKGAVIVWEDLDMVRPTSRDSPARHQGDFGESNWRVPTECRRRRIAAFMRSRDGQSEKFVMSAGWGNIVVTSTTTGESQVFRPWTDPAPDRLSSEQGAAKHSICIASGEFASGWVVTVGGRYSEALHYDCRIDQFGAFEQVMFEQPLYERLRDTHACDFRAAAVGGPEDSPVIVFGDEKGWLFIVDWNSKTLRKAFMTVEGAVEYLGIHQIGEDFFILSNTVRRYDGTLNHATMQSWTLAGEKASWAIEESGVQMASATRRSGTPFIVSADGDGNASSVQMFEARGTGLQSLRQRPRQLDKDIVTALAIGGTENPGAWAAGTRDGEVSVSRIWDMCQEITRIRLGEKIEDMLFDESLLIVATARGLTAFSIQP
ncbi:MAG: hypothetical protein ACT4PZ_24625 [Panacagrimonas sp.]